MPIVVADEASPEPSATQGAAITIELCGARVHVAAGIDATALQTVLRAALA